MDKSELVQYVEKFQLGDISAFEVIYNETNKQVYNLLYSYTKNEHTSLDLMQETYLTVNRKIGTIKDPYAIKSWINRIAINKANRFFEKNKKEILLSEEGQDLFETQFEEDEEFLPQEILDSKEKQRIIKDIIDNLPIEQKTAVYLYYFDELSLAEVAEDMECSEGTVKSRLNYARKKIKTEVNTWEKKGTKLYGTGVPVLLLLLENQLGIENISLDKANILLKNIVNDVYEGSVISTMPKTAKANHNLNNTIDGTAKAIGKVFGIKLIAAAGIIIAISAGSLTFMNKTSVTQYNSTTTNKSTDEGDSTSEDNYVIGSFITKPQFEVANYGQIFVKYKVNGAGEYLRTGTIYDNDGKVVSKMNWGDTGKNYVQGDEEKLPIADTLAQMKEGEYLIFKVSPKDNKNSAVISERITVTQNNKLNISESDITIKGDNSKHILTFTNKHNFEEGIYVLYGKLYNEGTFSACHKSDGSQSSFDIANFKYDEWINRKIKEMQIARIYDVEVSDDGSSTLRVELSENLNVDSLNFQ